MYFLALAADFDGTIAEHGTVRSETVRALRELKASGRQLLLVTGGNWSICSTRLPNSTCSIAWSRKMVR